MVDGVPTSALAADPGLAPPNPGCHPQPSLWRASLLALTGLLGCAPQANNVIPPGPTCLDVRWPLALPFGAGLRLDDGVRDFHPPLPCAATADCPPGSVCHDHDAGRICRVSDDVRADLTPAELLGVPRFDVEVIGDIGGQRVRLSGLPALADFAICSFYSCTIDAETASDDPLRCLLDTRRVDLLRSSDLPLPPSTAATRATPTEQLACQAHPETGAPLRLRTTPTAFSMMCVAYRASGIAAASDVVPLRPEQIGAVALDTYQPVCSDATTGSACPHPRAGSHQLGICVGELCCLSCAASIPGGTRLEQACASVNAVVVDTEDERYVQLGHALYGVCYDAAGRARCKVDGFIPADPPSQVCVPRSEPGLDVPAPRAHDGDGDGVSVDLDCDDDDPSRGAITYEATTDGVDQDCDGRVDEVTVRPCPFDPDMVVVGDGATCIDRYEASRPDATAESPGQVAGPARSRPGVLPWTDVTYGVAEAACAAAGKGLCRADVFRQNCLHASGSVFPYGPSYDPRGCNGADGLFGRLMPAGTLDGCAGQSGAADVVGNASEWVLDRAAVGGSYRSSTAGLSCLTSRLYDAADASGFSAPWLGFRCCRSP